jgi:hypothetical protein
MVLICRRHSYSLLPTCDVEYQAESEGNLDLEVKVPGFQALTMRPFTFIPAE